LPGVDITSFMPRKRLKQAPKLILSIAVTRRILGPESDKFSDEEITNLIQDIDLLAQALIQMVQKESTNLKELTYNRSKL
jgi:hypothetical protein